MRILLPLVLFVSSCIAQNNNQYQWRPLVQRHLGSNPIVKKCLDNSTSPYAVIGVTATLWMVRAVCQQEPLTTCVLASCATLGTLYLFKKK